MSKEIIINNMPNVYVNNVTITENNNATSIEIKVSLFDNYNTTKRTWSARRVAKNIKVNASLVENSTNINSIKNKMVTLSPKDVVSVLSTNTVSSSKEGEYIKFDYVLKIKLKRKLSREASLFFYTSMDRARIRRSNKRRNKNVKIQNHGIYLKSKNKRHTKTREKVGGTKQVVLFKAGQKVKKLPVYLRADGTQWHGEVIYSKPLKGFLANFYKVKREKLERKMIDNNVIIYNIPIKAIKNDKKRAIPVRKLKHKKLPLVKKFNKGGHRPFMYEMEENVDHEGNLHKFFMLNLCNLALSQSRTAQKIYLVNKDLFMKISDDLSFGKIKIIRSKFKSLSRHRKISKSKYRRNRRKISKRGNKNKRIVAHLNMRKPFKKLGFINPDNRLFGRKTGPMANLEIVNAGLGPDIKALYFVDKSLKNAGKGRISYKVEMDFDDLYYMYVKKVLKDIILFKKEILGIKNTAVKTKSFRRASGKFKGSFIEKYFRKQNIDFSATMGVSDALKNSPLIRGLSAVDKASLLLGMDPEEIQIDNKINLSTATPKMLRSTLEDLNRIMLLLMKRYDIKPTFNRVSGSGKGLKARKANKRKIIQVGFPLKTERNVKKEFVTYQYLKPDSKMKVNKAQFDSRAQREFKKYFSGIPTDGDIYGDLLDAETKAKMLKVADNKYQFLTTSVIHTSRSKTSTSAFGPKINTKFFNLIKTIRKKVNSNKNLKTFNFNIAQNTPVMLRLANSLSVESSEENTLEARRFLGKSSPFLNTSLVKRNFNNLKQKGKIGKIANRFVFENKSINTIAAFDLANENSALYQQISDHKINPSEIPLQIKSLILNRSVAVKTNFLADKDDIFKNPSTDEIAYQMYGNIQEVKYIDSFEVGKDGLTNMKAPIIKSMTGENYSSIGSSNKICFLQKYNNKMIVDKKDPFKIFGSVFLLVDKGDSPKPPKGKVSYDEGHAHEYKVDEHGNGYTSIAMHPGNPKIRHRHRIINWVVQESKSSCYPRCKEKFGHEGVKNHEHKILRRKKLSKIRTNDKIARRFVNNFKPVSSIVKAPSPTVTAPITATMPPTPGGMGDDY